MTVTAATGCSLSLGLDGLDGATRATGAGGGTSLAGQSGSAGADAAGASGATAGSDGGAGGAGFPGAGGAAGMVGKGGGANGGQSGGGQSGSAGNGGAGNGGAGGNAKTTTTLATNQKTPLGIGLDDLHVYWVDVAPAAIYRVLKTGGNPEPLLDAVDLADPRDVAVEGTTLYWSEWTGNLVRKRDLSGGATKTFVTGGGRVGAIAINSGILYATDDRTDQPTEGTVAFVPAGGTPAAQVLFAMQPLATGMAVAGNELAWARSGSILLGPATGGTPVVLVPRATTVKVSGVALDDVNVYWIEDEQRIMVANRASGNVATFYDPPGAFGRGDVAVDATHVYWTEPDSGAIRKQLRAP